LALEKGNPSVLHVEMGKKIYVRAVLKSHFTKNTLGCEEKTIEMELKQLYVLMKQREPMICLNAFYLIGCHINRTIQGFGEAKLGYGGLVLGSSPFSLFTKLPKKIMPDSKRS